MNFSSGLFNPDMLKAALAAAGVSIQRLEFDADGRRVQLWLRTRQGAQYREIPYAEIQQFFTGQSPDE